MTTTAIRPPLPRPAAAGTRDPFDPAYCRDLVQRVIEPLSDFYFRPRIFGAHKLPDRGPAILAANHSGTAFPYDAIVFDLALWKRDGMRVGAKWRSVYEKELTLAWWMRPFGLDDLWRRGGGVDMTFDNFERLLQRGERVIYYPEGVPGIGKGFQHRYQLQRFRTSFVRLAARYDVPIYPVSVVNAEWVMPYHFTLPPLDHAMQRFFHVPFLPLPAGILALIFPWMWYLALPAHMTFVIGDRIDAHAVLGEVGVHDDEEPDRNAANRAAHRIRRQMQEALDRDVAAYGRRPYDRKTLVRAWRTAAHRGLLRRTLPTGWPVSFIRNERDHFRPPPRNRLVAVLRDLDLIAFYLPLGWPLLSLARRFRRPPYGYRGLSLADIREKQGNFIWRLSERPLPPPPDRAPGRASA